MDAQFTTIIVPKGRRGSRYDLEDIEFSSPHTNDNFYHKSCQQHKERISTYDKIVQEMSKDESDSFGTSLLSILGGGDTNVISPSTSPDTNTTDGGTLTLYPSGGIHFKRRPSLKLDLPYASFHLPSETKDISTRGSSPNVKSPHQLLDFVEKFNQQEDENLCPDDFLEYRDSQSVELKTESGGTVVYQNNQVNFDTSLHESEKKIYDMNYICLGKQCINPAHNHTVDNNQEMCPNTLNQVVDPLSTISSPLDLFSLKNKEANTAVSNTSEMPQLMPKEKIPNVTISSVANNPNMLHLISKVHRMSVSSISSPTNTMKDEEYKTVSAMSSISNTVNLEESETIISTFQSNSTSSQPIPQTRGRRLSDSLLGFFTGIFGSSPTQVCSSPKSLSERSEHIKEVAEMSMIFRY